MYKKNKASRTAMSVNESYIGEMIEQKVERIMTNSEPISDGAPIIYTERKDGVMPEYDVRTDRWDVAIDAMDKVTKSHKAKREESAKEREDKKRGKEAKENMEVEKKSEKAINPGTGDNTSDK